MKLLHIVQWQIKWDRLKPGWGLVVAFKRIVKPRDFKHWDTIRTYGNAVVFVMN
jgi:hypothetical protein